MADRYNYYFGQTVKEDEMNWAFNALESAIWRASRFAYGKGIIEGGLLHETTPVSSVALNVDAFKLIDRQGIFVELPGQYLCSCSSDYEGFTTVEDLTAGRGRWVGIFAAFKRELSEPKQDDNGQTVYSKELESYNIFIKAGALGYVGDGTGGTVAGELYETLDPPVLLDRPNPPEIYEDAYDFRPDAVILGDVKMVHGATSILDADIDYSRREDWIRETEYERIADDVLVAGTARDALIQFADWLDETLAGMNAESWWENIGANQGQSYKNGALTVVGDPTIKNVFARLIADLADATSADSNGLHRIGCPALKFGTFGWTETKSGYEAIKYIIESLNSTAGASHIGHTQVYGANGLLSSGSGSVQAAISSIVTTADAFFKTISDVVTNHINSTSAHTAANIPIVDSANRYTSEQVEAALAEIAGFGRTTAMTVKSAYDKADDAKSRLDGCVTDYRLMFSSQAVTQLTETTVIFNSNQQTGWGDYVQDGGTSDWRFVPGKAGKFLVNFHILTENQTALSFAKVFEQVNGSANKMVCSRIIPDTGANNLEFGLNGSFIFQSTNATDYMRLRIYSLTDLTLFSKSNRPETNDVRGSYIEIIELEV